MNSARHSAALGPILRFALSAVLGLCACQTNDPPHIARGGVVRIGTDATFPPFESRDSSTGEVVGFDVDLARAVFGRLGYAAEFEVVHLDALIPGLIRNEFDCVMSAYTMTTERREQVLFSRPYYETGLAIVTAAGDSAISGIADLVGKRVGAQRGSTGERLAQRIFRAEVFSYDSIGQAFRALEGGALHAVLNDRPTSALYVSAGDQVKIVPGIVERERYGAAFRKSDGRLMERFDSVLAEYMETRDFGRLLRRYGLQSEAQP